MSQRQPLGCVRRVYLTRRTPFTRTLFACASIPTVALKPFFLYFALFTIAHARVPQLDEIEIRFAAAGPAIHMLTREVAVMTKKLEGLLQR